MNYRKLRIAWSVGWGVLAVLLGILGVRSYWRADIMAIPHGATGATVFCSAHGVLMVTVVTDVVNPATDVLAWSEPLFDWEFSAGGAPYPFFFHTEKSRLQLGFPHILMAAGAVALALLPWVRWRFSLRTLLIVTAVVAVLIQLSFL